MDDLFVMSSLTKGTQLLLNRCTQILTWAGMSFRAETSRCIVIDGGVVHECIVTSFEYHKGCGTMGVPVFASENIELTFAKCKIFELR